MGGRCRRCVLRRAAARPPRCALRRRGRAERNQRSRHSTPNRPAAKREKRWPSEAASAADGTA
jgi:hypothetical protein